MGKRKNRDGMTRAQRKAAAEKKKRSLLESREVMPGVMLPASLDLPPGSKSFLIRYLTEHQEEEWRPKTNIEIAEKAGAVERISSLLSAYHIIHAVGTMMTSEVEDLVKNYGLLVKGVQPAINTLNRAEEAYGSVMWRTIRHGEAGNEADREYMRDFDSLYAKIYCWFRIPQKWEAGEDARLPLVSEERRKMAKAEGCLYIDTGHEMMKVHPSELSEVKGAKTDYSIARLQKDETGIVVNDHIKTERGAERIARRLIRENPEETFVVYRTEHRTREEATAVPVMAFSESEINRHSKNNKEK